MHMPKSYNAPSKTSGLLMDGFHDNPSINLHKEYMRADNIVELFQKYEVPFPHFDQLTVDIDMNTPWVLRAILAGGYRPRSVTVEYNRNFHSNDSYMVINAPTTNPDGCWFGASGLALERLMRAFDYSLVAFDENGINLFFVHNKELGRPFPHSFADLTPNYQLRAWQTLHPDCQNNLWVMVNESTALASPEWQKHLHPAVLSHSAKGAARIFSKVDLGSVLRMSPEAPISNTCVRGWPLVQQAMIPALGLFGLWLIYLKSGQKKKYPKAKVVSV